LEDELPNVIKTMSLLDISLEEFGQHYTKVKDEKK
jgi:hypothetical protein